MHPHPNGHWGNIREVETRTFDCGYCGHRVASNKGWNTEARPQGLIRICSYCNRPTYLMQEGAEDFQSPPGLPGVAVRHLPADVGALYDETRRAIGASSHTAAVLAMRKILMHVAVDCGAKENQTFVAYVQYLSDQNYVAVKSKTWVDRIRTRGNEANHDIVVMSKPDADELLSFTEMLLKTVYEYPQLGAQASAKSPTP